MAKKNKARIDKNTRKIIENISDLISKRKNGDGFKIKAKGKQVKQIKRTCAHWMFRKGKLLPAVAVSNEIKGELKCLICGKTFPENSLTPEEANDMCRAFLQMVDQAFFFSVKMGGDASDAKIFETLKRVVPRFNKIYNNEMKHLNKFIKQEQQRKENLDGLNQFDAYGSLRFKR